MEDLRHRLASVYHARAGHAYRSTPLAPPPESASGCATDCGSGSCLVSCSNQKYDPKKYLLTCSPDTCRRIRGLVDKHNEAGGILEPNFETGQLDLVVASNGDRDSVAIPTGVFQFHTHPNTCKSRKACYFEFPSENDMGLIARDCMSGVLAHFVFTHGKTYRVSLQPGQRLRYAQQPALIEGVFPHFAELMNRLQQQAVDEGIGIMDRLREEWRREAVAKGFEVQVLDGPEGIRETVRAIAPGT